MKIDEKGLQAACATLDKRGYEVMSWCVAEAITAYEAARAASSDEETLRAQLYDILCAHEVTGGLIMDKFMDKLRPYLRTASPYNAGKVVAVLDKAIRMLADDETTTGRELRNIYRAALLAANQAAPNASPGDGWNCAREKWPDIDKVVSGMVNGFVYPVPVSVAFIATDNKPRWRIWPRTETFMPDILDGDQVTHWMPLPTPPASSGEGE